MSTTDDPNRKTIGDLDSGPVWIEHVSLATKDKQAHTDPDCPRFNGETDDDRRDDLGTLHDDHLVCKVCTGDVWYDQEDADHSDRAGNKITSKVRGLWADEEA